MKRFLAYATAGILILSAMAGPGLCLSPQPNMNVTFRRGDKLGRALSQAVTGWLGDARRAVTTYYGQFPVRLLEVVVYADDSDEIGFATAGWENGRPIIEIPVGRRVNTGKLKAAWTATHEMVHLAFPIVDDEDKWVAEGMATYIEPLARLQAGEVTRESVWGEFFENAPAGIPSSRSGLRGTNEWGPLYWGGATYCLLADLEIRKQTNNRIGFQDAMREIVKAGATADSDYSAEQALAIGDKAIGLSVLVPLYKQMSDSPSRVNLSALQSKLGVIRTGAGTKFNDNAPLAPLRISIERGKRA